MDVLLVSTIYQPVGCNPHRVVLRRHKIKRYGKYEMEYVVHLQIFREDGIIAYSSGLYVTDFDRAVRDFNVREEHISSNLTNPMSCGDLLTYFRECAQKQEALMHGSSQEVG